MRKTSNIELSLYDPTDTFDITGSSNSLNHNMEIIDQKFFDTPTSSDIEKASKDIASLKTETNSLKEDIKILNNVEKVNDILADASFGYVNPEGLNVRKNGNDIIVTVAENHGYMFNVPMKLGHKYILSLTLYDSMYVVISALNSSDTSYASGETYYESKLYTPGNRTFEIVPTIENACLYLYVGNATARENYTEMSLALYDITGITDISGIDFSTLERTISATDSGLVPGLRHDLNRIAEYGNITDVIRNSTVGEFYKNPTSSVWNKNGALVTSPITEPSGCSFDKLLKKGRKYRIVCKFTDSGHYIEISGLNSSEINVETYFPNKYCAKDSVFLQDIAPSQDVYLYAYITGTNGVELHISVYDVTNINELAIKNINFTTFADEYTDILQSGKLSEIEESLVSEWNGKKLTTFGDSNVDNERWQPYLVTKYGFLHTNCGIGGTTVTTHTNGMCTDERVNTIPTSTDLLIFLGGTNDWLNSIPLGEKSMDNTDTSTFYGALNIMFQKIVTRIPKARLFALGTGVSIKLSYDSSWTDGKHNSIGLTPKDYNDAVGEVASWYGIPFGNVFSNSGMNWTNITSFFVNDGNYIHFDSENGGRRVAECANAMLKSYEPFNHNSN